MSRPASRSFGTRPMSTALDPAQAALPRRCDVLLIDDIQFLGNQARRRQKEFFYTFNALHEMSKPDRPHLGPAAGVIPGLEDRLRSRFNMGLITDIQEPNYETRVAILKKKAEADGFDLPDDVLHFIATSIVRRTSASSKVR